MKHTNQIGEDSFSNLLGLLTVLSKQLDMSMDEGSFDYGVIHRKLLGILDKEAAVADDVMPVSEGASKELITALQFFDRLTQRVSHVSESLKMVAEHLNDISRQLDSSEWSMLKLDLDNEIKKTLSFYNNSQAAEMCEMVALNSAWLVDHRDEEFTQISVARQSSDVEFF